MKFTCDKKTIDIYKKVLNLQLLIIDKELMEIIVSHKTFNIFLSEVQNRIITGYYYIQYNNNDCDGFHYLIEHITDKDVLNYLMEIAKYVTDCKIQSELNYNAQKVANALMGISNDDDDDDDWNSLLS